MKNLNEQNLIVALRMGLITFSDFLDRWRKLSAIAILLLLSACAQEGASNQGHLSEPGFQPQNQCCNGSEHCTKHMVDDESGRLAFACFAPTDDPDKCQVCYRLDGNDE